MRSLLTGGRRALLLAVALLAAGAARADTLHVISSGAFNGTYELIAPEYQRRTGHVLRYAYGASMGDSPDSMPNRLARGEAADVLILVGNALPTLAARGFVAPDSRVDLAVSRIGVVIPAGSSAPDLSSVDGLRRALLAAPSIAYSASASGTYFSGTLVQQLGIADQVLPKSRRIFNERVAAVVARGEAAFGLQQVSEITEVLLGPEGHRITLVGPLPDAVQQVVPISAAIGARAQNAALARDFIAFLGSPEAHAAMRRMGLDPLEARR